MKWFVLTLGMALLNQPLVLGQKTPPVKMVNYLRKADQAYSKQNLAASYKSYQKALAISDSVVLPNYTILICINIADVKNQTGQYTEALNYVRKAQAYHRKFNDKSIRRKFMIFSRYASGYQSLAKVDSAELYFNLCADLIKTHFDSLDSFNSQLASYYIDRSLAAYESLAINESIALNKEAIRRYKRQANFTKGLLASPYNQLAKSYVLLGNMADADASFLQAVKFYSNEPLFQAIVLCNLTESKLQQNATKSARNTLQQAQRAYRRYFYQTPRPAIDIDVERRLKQNEANVLLAEGKLTAAKAAFADLLSFCKTHFQASSPFRVDIHLSLSKLYQRERNFGTAQQSLDAAIREAYGPNAKSWEQSALLRSLLEALTQKAHFLANTPAPNPTTRRLNAKGALLVYEQAIDLTAILRRGALLPESKAFLAQKSADLYSPALSLCYELAQQPGMASIFQQRAFALFDKQQNSLLADAQFEQQLVRKYLPQTLQTEFQTLNKRLSQLRLVRENSSNTALETELNKTEKGLLEWQQKVAHNYPAYSQSLHKISQLSMNDYRQQLTPGELLLCYAPTPAGLLMLTLDQEGCTFRRIPIALGPLKQAIDRYRAEVSRDPGIVGYYNNQLARSLHKILLTPIQDRLREANALTVVAPPNWQIPFEALENQMGRAQIFETDIAYQFNLSSRLLTNESEQLAKHETLTMAPFGADTGQGPFQMKTGHWLPPLRASVEESSLLDGLRLLGRKASKQRFLADAPKAKILLLTTHTYPGERETALVFYPSSHNESDYLLYPSELQHVDLRTVDFTALSACATEKGAQLPGDGVHSLGRAAAWAGARSVTCSWFPINDEAQALLGHYFYPKLTNGKSMRENLRQARLEFLSSAEGLRYSGHPFYWASTALYGGHNAVATNSFWHNPWIVSLLTCFLGLVVWVIFRQKPLPKTSVF